MGQGVSRYRAGSDMTHRVVGRSGNRGLARLLRPPAPWARCRACSSHSQSGVCTFDPEVARSLEPMGHLACSLHRAAAEPERGINRIDSGTPASGCARPVRYPPEAPDFPFSNTIEDRTRRFPHSVGSGSSQLPLPSIPPIIATPGNVKHELVASCKTPFLLVRHGG
jgi:hypothetical protein